MACGRLVGGRLVRSFGATHVLVYGSVLAATGMLAAALAPVVAAALAGFALVGLGLANVFPLAIARAGSLGGSKGVALASTVGYTGLLGGPPLIGLLVGGVGLPAALSRPLSLRSLQAGACTPRRSALLHARSPTRRRRPRSPVAGTSRRWSLRPVSAAGPTTSRCSAPPPQGRRTGARRGRLPAMTPLGSVLARAPRSAFAVESTRTVASRHREREPDVRRGAAIGALRTWRNAYTPWSAC
jgi:MFS family permease